MSPRNRFFILLGIIFVIARGLLLLLYRPHQRSGADWHGGLEPGHRQPASAGGRIRNCWSMKARR